MKHTLISIHRVGVVIIFLLDILNGVNAVLTIWGIDSRPRRNFEPTDGCRRLWQLDDQRRLMHSGDERRHPLGHRLPLSDNKLSVALLGFNTGTGLPAVFPKQVRRVRVRSWFLAHCDTPRTHTAVLWVCTGKFTRGELNFYCFKTCFFQCFLVFLFSFCIVSHRDTTK